jgi:hypothetical protein
MMPLHDEAVTGGQAVALASVRSAWFPAPIRRSGHPGLGQFDGNPQVDLART